MYQTVGECAADGGGRRLGRVGRPLPNVLCAVAAPPGEVGEIYLGGPLLARGYLKAPALTAEKFVWIGCGGARGGGEVMPPARYLEADLQTPNHRWLEPGRWFKTGDLGCWHGSSSAVVRGGGAGCSEEEGATTAELELWGRIDSQIKLRGVRIELGEVESVLADHALVETAVVVLHEDQPAEDATCLTPAECEAKLGSGAASTAEPEAEQAGLEAGPEPLRRPGQPRLVAYIVLASGVSPAAWDAGGAEAAVRVHSRRQLPAHAVPAQLVHLDGMPLTASGKVDRLALITPPPLLDRNRRNDVVAEGQVPVMSAMETTVIGAWAGALGIPAARLSQEDDFFALGGTSVAVVEVVKRLQAAARESAEGDEDWVEGAPNTVRYCALYRKPKLADYATFLEWLAVAAPAGSGRNAEELLGLMEVALPGNDDELALLNAALKLAARGGHTAVTAALLAADACPDGGYSKKNRGDTPLIMAAGAGHAEVVAQLIDAGATANLPSASGRTALHLTAAGGHAALLRWMLVEGGCYSVAKDVNKWTALHFAAYHGHAEVVEILLRSKVAQSLGLAHEWRCRATGEMNEIRLTEELERLRCGLTHDPNTVARGTAMVCSSRDHSTCKCLSNTCPVFACWQIFCRHDERALQEGTDFAPLEKEISIGGPGRQKIGVGLAALASAVRAAEESLGTTYIYQRGLTTVVDAKDRWFRTSLS
eukprot:SAG22_NODE_330_length_12211_cov_6.451948_4_plen_709_part_00